MQLYRAAVTLHILQAEMYIEDAVTHSTVLEGKSQPQTEPCAERQLQTTQSNRETQTTEEGQLKIRDKPGL